VYIYDLLDEGVLDSSNRGKRRNSIDCS